MLQTHLSLLLRISPELQPHGHLYLLFSTLFPSALPAMQLGLAGVVLGLRSGTNAFRLSYVEMPWAYSSHQSEQLSF